MFKNEPKNAPISKQKRYWEISDRISLTHQYLLCSKYQKFLFTLNLVIKFDFHIFFTLWQFKIENTEIRKSCWCCIPLPWMNWDVKEFAKLKLWIVPETPVNHWRQLKSAVQFVLHGTYTILGQLINPGSMFSRHRFTRI